MAHGHKKMALYEAMTKARFKSSYGKKLDRLHPEKSDETERASANAESVISGRAAQWWRKPRIVQFNTGRIEFSVSYPLAIALLLVIILLFLAAFRLGQRMSDSVGKIPQDVLEKPVGQPITETSLAVDKPEKTAPVAVSGEKTESSAPKGSNVIVLVEYQTQADLVPVQKHFAEFGIETELVNLAGRYFLITKDRFDGFGPGSDGFRARQKIVEVGALYKDKAPEGYETFAPNFFKDAYGKKVE